MRIKDYLLLSVTCVALLIMVAVTACGKDLYSGTWRNTYERAGGGSNVITIERSGDGWTVTDPLGEHYTAAESNGRLVGRGAGFSFERKGEKLIARVGDTVVGEYVKKE